MMGIIGLIDVHRHPERIIRQLAHRIHDQAIIPGPVVGGDHIKTVADLK